MKVRVIGTVDTGRGKVRVNRVIHVNNFADAIEIVLREYPANKGHELDAQELGGDE